MTVLQTPTTPDELAQEIERIINRYGDLDQRVRIIAVMMVLGDLLGSISCPDCRALARGRW